MAGLKATADLKAADRNPYSWNMEFFAYPDGSGCSPVQQMRHLHAYAGIGPCRPDPGHVPLRLYHERIGRNHGFCAGNTPWPPGDLPATAGTNRKKKASLHRRKNWGKPPAFPAVFVL